ncbi:acetyl-CoA carboxylase biotin carboxyl carrier protein subunit [Bdellovibrio bacteriovorus]|uniref:Acetyl-CoA carboxylase biotin carboxyl carrier protein subunit n=1 Tax=Bdellovibrio bacteriovorus TaxID=959 RepID=A0A150WWN8_BDEBC|nr:acetyl-CoA carboxylase biotin carboxyl carrier protein subunit [Bdellovibrio bacteriovorus]KYG68925.1 acetyl-CoA carboxylase biotin carboxyl carrier protein subunit [Bdellovibrio bacteriovorus]KYG70819.1 acetyl-CoA carboxylase biotin carboxyl carrier protein subunit [Bdellovibrio bacteriovorus]
MYFEAELNGKKYKVDVTEQRSTWKVSLQEEGKNWLHYDISKRDFKEAEQYISFLFEGKSYLIDVIGQDTEYTVFTRNSFRTIKVFNDEMLLHESLKKGGNFGADQELKSGMPGKIIEIFAKEGEIVKANKPLLIMEAMKMENEMRATRDVKIKEIKVKQGDSVESGAVLIKFEEP